MQGAARVIISRRCYRDIARCNYGYNSAMTSLRQKITLGYTAFALLLVALSVRSLIELHQIEQQIKAGARIAEFFDVTLEIRRFEKNLFLYHQAQDVHENALYLNRARQLLAENHATFIELAPEAKISVARTD